MVLGLAVHWVIFSDMDGTFIDHDTYSYEEALPAFELMRDAGVPLVFTTSKTRAEIDAFQDRLDIHEPFISENGGAIFVPRGYFDFEYDWDFEMGKYRVIELGTPYRELRNALIEAREAVDCDAIGFGDMSAEEVAGDTGLDQESAELAKRRDYDEPFKVDCPPERADQLVELLRARGLTVTRGGRYYHVMGDNDKGRAVRILTNVYKRQWPDLRTMGLGDSLNDEPLLRAVDYPVLVQKPDDEYDENVGVDGLTRAEGVGPTGWNRAVTGILEEK